MKFHENVSLICIFIPGHMLLAECYMYVFCGLSVYLSVHPSDLMSVLEENERNYSTISST